MTSCRARASSSAGAMLCLLWLHVQHAWPFKRQLRDSQVSTELQR